MVISFQYTTQDMTPVPKPIIPIILFRKGEDPKDPSKGLGKGMLVDSGADITTISKTTAETLGIDVNSLNDGTTNGIGGNNIPVKFVELTFVLQRGGEAYCFDTEVQIMDDQRLKYPLLGRNFIFSKFDITFRERKLRVEFIRKVTTEVKKIKPLNR